MNIGIILLRFFMAIICGTIIGLEREIHDKAAGLRTHILVCLGACIFGLHGMAVTLSYSGDDILRLSQGLTVGIGFLGAGVIFREGTSIKGLTTAAGIWVMGAIGLAVGVGQYNIALLGTIFCFITVSLFRKIESLVKK